MKNDKKKFIYGETKLISLKLSFTWTLLVVFAMSVSRVDAVYYRSRVRGSRDTVVSPGVGVGGSAIDRSKIQTTGNPNVIGQICYDDKGNVIVRWPLLVNGFGVFFDQDSLAPGQYENESEFLKAYMGKCEARGKEPEDRRRLGGGKSERDRVFRASGKKVWAAHLKVLQASRATEKKFLTGLPLVSLFGIKIGKPIDVALYEKSGAGDCYVFKPTKQFRRFDSYSLKVTPKSHLVYQITAKADRFADSEGWDEEWNHVRQVLMKKFQKLAVKEADDQDGYKLLFPCAGVGNGVEREIIVHRSEESVYITAVDLRLAKQAKEEQASIDAKSLVPSINDLDAL